MWDSRKWNPMIFAGSPSSTRHVALNLLDLPREQDALLVAANQSSAASSTSTRRRRGETIMLQPYKPSKSILNHSSNPLTLLLETCFYPFDLSKIHESLSRDLGFGRKSAFKRQLQVVSHVGRPFEIHVLFSEIVDWVGRCWKRYASLPFKALKTPLITSDVIPHRTWLLATDQDPWCWWAHMAKLHIRFLFQQKTGGEGNTSIWMA